jgi:prevent-host-death family protein
MVTVGAYEAKTKLPELLKRVERGEHITIARHGTPIAVIVPIREFPQKDPVAAGAAIKEFARTHSRGDFDIRAAIEEGRH